MHEAKTIMPYHERMSSRPLVSKELLYTIAPLAIAAGFAFAAHGGFLCSGGHETQVKVVAKAHPGTKVEVFHDSRKVKAKKRRAKKRRGGVDPKALGSKIYRATETHWVPRSVVEKLVADPGLLSIYGDLVPIREGSAECSGMIGYRVENTLKGGVIRRLGFHDGDLITAIDGVHLESRRAARRALSGVEGADQVTVTIVRNDKTLQKTFLIE